MSENICVAPSLSPYEWDSRKIIDFHIQTVSKLPHRDRVLSPRGNLEVGDSAVVIDT